MNGSAHYAHQVDPIHQRGMGVHLQFIVRSMLVVAGVIHILPLSGVLGAKHLERLYGVTFTDPNLIVMMRHRAILFALLGAFLLYAAFRPDLVSIAIVGGLISAATFIWLALAVGGYNGAIARIIIADAIAVVCLLIAAICQVLASPQS